MKLFFSTFTLIFLAELPDKTSFANFFLAIRHKPLAVFTGAAAAFAIQSAVAVAFGRLIGTFSPVIVHRVAGFLFLFFAIWFLFQSEELDEEKELEAASRSKRFWADAGIAFTAIFMAEWGDLTQLATATLAAKYEASLIIFISSTLALWLATAVSVTLGHRGGKLVNTKILKWIGAAAFFVVGTWLLIYG